MELKSAAVFARRSVMPGLLISLLTACGGGGGSSGGDTGGSAPPPPPVQNLPFDTSTQADTVKSVALTALVQTLYSATGYLVDDSIAYHAAYSSSPSDPDGKVTASGITCSAGSDSVVADSSSATYSPDNSVVYQLNIDTAGCQLPTSTNSIATAETGGVDINEGYDSTGLPVIYEYQFGPASTDSSADGTHTLTSTVSGVSIASTSDDTDIVGTRSGTATSATIREQIDGSLTESKSGVAAQLGFTATFTRLLNVDAGQPTLVTGPADASEHFSKMDSAAWGNETCLTAINESILDIDSAAPLQYSSTNNLLSVSGGKLSGTFVTDANDFVYKVSISISSQGIATVTVVDADSVSTTSTFDANALLKSTSICGGSAAFWQQAGRHTALAKRIQGS